MTIYAGAENFASWLGLKPSEDVIILSDNRETYAGPLAILAAALEKTGARITLEFTLPRDLQADIPSALHDKLTSSDIIILSASQSWYQAPMRRRLKREFKKRVVETYDMKLQTLQSGALLADMSQIRRSNESIVGMLRGKKRLRALTSDGTDFTAMIREAGSESGDYSLPGSGGNLPAGEVWMSVEPQSAAGKLSFGVSFDGLGCLASRDLELECAGGRITSVSGTRAGEFHALMERFPNLGNIAEISIGTNPSSIEGRNVLEDEKKLGMIHVGFGNDTYFGGSTPGPHLDGVIRGATLEVDGTTLISAGTISL